MQRGWIEWRRRREPNRGERREGRRGVWLARTRVIERCLDRTDREGERGNRESNGFHMYQNKTRQIQTDRWKEGRVRRKERSGPVSCCVCGMRLSGLWLCKREHESRKRPHFFDFLWFSSSKKILWWSYKVMGVVIFCLLARFWPLSMYRVYLLLGNNNADHCHHNAYWLVTENLTYTIWLFFCLLWISALSMLAPDLVNVLGRSDIYLISKNLSENTTQRHVGQTEIWLFKPVEEDEIHSSQMLKSCKCVHLQDSYVIFPIVHLHQ